MADPKKPTAHETQETAEQKAARIQRIKDAVNKSKSDRGLMPSTPEEADALDRQIEAMKKKQENFERNYSGLKLPPLVSQRLP